MVCSKKISVKRSHGIGNIILLLPVLDRFIEFGFKVELITKLKWISVFSDLRPMIKFIDKPKNETMDLDSLTKRLLPSRYRSDEFGILLGIKPPFCAPQISPIEAWTESFKNYENYNTIIFAPEAGHPARSWSINNVIKTCEMMLKNYYLILIGLNTSPKLPCHKDLRGKLSLQELIGLLSMGKTVVSMDSGCLHLSTALAIPTVAILGGINPEYRIHRDHRCVAIQTKLTCCPCNKLESCNGAYYCLDIIQPDHILEAIDIVAKITNRTIWRI